MRISDWSSDVCSSDLVGGIGQLGVYAFHDPFEGVLLIDVNGLSVSLRPMPDGIDYRETEEHRIGAQRGGIDDAQNIAVRLVPHAQNLFRSDECRVGQEGSRQLRCR